MKINLLILALVGIFLPQTGRSFPEFAGDGYFSCTSCHVSPSGGDLLTSYGRSFAEEKVAAFHAEGEGQPFHGKVPLPEWFLVGGHFRELQMNYEDATSKEGRHFRMQQEIDLGTRIKNVWSYATISSERKSNNPYEYDLHKPLISKWLLRFDPIEAISVRVGRVQPKFGLNVADHNAYVRQNIGLGAGQEKKLTEISYFSERLEVNLSQSTSALPDTKLDSQSRSEKESNQAYANVSTFWAEAHRVSVSAMQDSSEDRRLQVVSGSAAVKLADNFRILSEHQLGLLKTKAELTKISQTYAKLWFHPFPGVFPYFLYERQLRVNSAEELLQDRIAFGSSYHPRPHFEITATLGTRRDLRTYTYGSTANFIFHYWL